MFFVALASVALSQSNVDDAPDWMWETLESFKAAGLLVDYSECIKHRTPSRYEAAVATYACVHNIDSLLVELSAKSRELDGESWTRLHGSGAKFTLLAKMSKDLSRELTSLGVDAAAFFQLASCLRVREGELWFRDQAPKLGCPSFSDVPKGHWAEQAMSHLKAVGVIQGYADGKWISK